MRLNEQQTERFLNALETSAIALKVIADTTTKNGLSIYEMEDHLRIIKFRIDDMSQHLGQLTMDPAKGRR